MSLYLHYMEPHVPFDPPAWALAGLAAIYARDGNVSEAIDRYKLGKNDLFAPAASAFGSSAFHPRPPD